MTRRTRRTIFYVLVGLFFVIGASVVLYAEGWRIDLSKWQPEKVGAVYIRSFPKDAQIYVDAQPVRNGSGILSQGTFISDLFPRTYSVALSAAGYADWRENVSVYPALVTELKYAVLVPNQPAATATGTVSAMSLISGELVTTSPTGTLLWRGQKIGNGTIVSASTELNDAIIKNAAGAYSLYDFTTGTPTDMGPTLAQNSIAPKNIFNILIDPYDATQAVFQTNGRVWMYDITAGAATLLAHASSGTAFGPAVAVSPSTIAWTSFQNASGTALILYDKFSKTISLTSSSVGGKNAQLQWVTNNLLGVLQTDGELYLYDTNAGTFQKLADDVKEFSAPPDGSILAAAEENSMEIFSFTDANTYHRFNLPQPDEIQKIIWYKDLAHLFVVYPDHVSFLDLQDASLNNFTTVANGTMPQYDLKANALSLISPAGDVVRFDFPN